MSDNPIASNVFIINGHMPMVTLRMSSTHWVTLQQVVSYNFSHQYPLVTTIDGHEIPCYSCNTSKADTAEGRAEIFWEWVATCIQAAMDEM